MSVFFLIVTLHAVSVSQISDNGYLDILRNAQIASQGRYPSGEMVVKLREGQRDVVPRHQLSECRLEWKGDKVRTECTQSPSIANENNLDNSPKNKLIWIIDKTKMIQYHIGGKRVIVSHMNSSEPPSAARLHPNFIWYGPLNFSGSRWSNYLNPASNPKIPASLVKFEYREPSQGLVEIVRSTEGRTNKARMTFSLANEGNVVEYELIPNSSGNIKRGKCEWKRDGSHRLYLQKYSSTNEFTTPSGKVETYVDYEVLSFNPDHPVPDSRFTEASLSLPSGVMVNDEVRGRNTRIGDADSKDVAKNLEGLIEEMRSRGFATPK